MKRFRMHLCIVACVTTVTLRAAPPQLSQYSPLALAPGQTTVVTLQGQNLLAAGNLWTTFAAKCEFLPAEDEASKKGEKLVCNVTVPRETQIGIGAIRLVTAEGVSNPVLPMLDDLPTMSESSENHSVIHAQPVQIPIAIDGQCEAVQEDMFRFPVAAGQRISFEIVAQRIGSKLDPVARILSADGTLQLQLDDSDGAGGDARFSHTFATAGDYILSLRDVRHAGGPEYRYRLRIGAFPLITSVYPAGGQSGSVMTFEMQGQLNERPAAIHVLMPTADVSPRLVSFGVSGAEDQGSGWFLAESNPGTETLQKEPNDSVVEATPVNLPSAINGRFDQVGDRDFYKFVGKKGQRLHCVAKTRDLGSPCDVTMNLTKIDGAQVAAARQEVDTVLDAEIPDDGEYILQVENLLVGGEAGHVYRIDASKVYGGFSLGAEHSQYSSPQAGTFLVKVLAQRRGYNGPIDLAVEGIGEGVKVEGNRLEGDETMLRITLPGSITQGELRHAKIIGTANISGTNVWVAANQRTSLAGLFPHTLSLPSELEQLIAVGVGPPFPPFFDLAVDTRELVFPQIVGATSFEVQIDRTNAAFKDPVAIGIEGLPEEIKATVAPVDDGLKAVRISLQGPADLPDREIPIQLVGTGRFQEQTRQVTLSNLKLHVSKPLVVSLEMNGAISAGGTQEANVRLRRFGDQPQPVRVHVSDGPVGLSAPIFVTIPGDASQITFPIAAEASAPLGRFDNLVVVATTTLMGQSVTVRSKPAIVEITSKASK